MRYPFVDFVLRGDSTEEPVRRAAAGAARVDGRSGRVENLTWKRADRSVVVGNPCDLRALRTSTTSRCLRTSLLLRSMLGVPPAFAISIPHLEWAAGSPITLLLSARAAGTQAAPSAAARGLRTGRSAAGRVPAFRSPEKLASAAYGRSPAFRARQSSWSTIPAWAACHGPSGCLACSRPCTRATRSSSSSTPRPATASSTSCRYSLPAWGVEMTLEAPDEALRRRNGKFAWLERARRRDDAERALRARVPQARRVSWSACPHQTYADALGIADYAEHLIERCGATTASNLRGAAGAVSRPRQPRVRASRSWRLAVPGRWKITVRHVCGTDGSRCRRATP